MNYYDLKQRIDSLNRSNSDPWPIEWQLDRSIDNSNHNYSRDELIAILDKHIEAKAEGNYLTKW
ncbi:MAG: hypothetical protein IH840_06585 [Candidatus Heimdallarchaeota archaeon]|nr:hypothetical protein [Candidatus Heimdallarchaeota archaeon]